MKKKLAVVILSSAMLATSVAGLAGCGGGGGSGKGFRDDPRAADAYEAYSYTGSKVGGYKTIADAISATVEADLDKMEDETVEPGTYGGYVTRKGGTRHIFDNRKGYGGANSDQFWYYEGGNALGGYNCWDDTNSLATLHNAKVITHATTNMGLSSSQHWNGYGLLDDHGREIPSSTVMAQTWELSSPMDAGVMMFPARKKGVSGMKYKVDLSSAQITPPYKGVTDPIYAFLGFYAWQDYYVLAVGIACDTATGDWYAYEGSSRDDSFSDVEYKIGKKLMSSKWVDSKDGGYWAPEVKTVDMEIKTVRMIDEEDGEKYWVDRMSFSFDGKEAYTRDVDDSTLNNHFAGQKISPDNGYVFTAGLDIKNEISSGSLVKNVDYFNGARFLNLTVKEAGIYFPTEQELNDVEYSIGTINKDWRGKYHDALLANDEGTQGTYDYTILNNYVCTSYQAVDGVDRYSFRFDGDPVGESDLGGTLKECQDKIDRLAGMTAENLNEYLADYDIVTKWYGADESHTGSTGIKTQHLNLVDFTNYLAAKKVYNDALNLSDAAKEVVAGLEKLSILTGYKEYKGWTAPEGAESITGYIWSEGQEFGKVYEKYQALGEIDKANVLRVYKGGAEEFGNWEEFYLGVKQYLDNADFTGMSYTMPTEKMDKNVTYNGTQALEKLFELGFKIWTTNYTDGEAVKFGFDSDSQAKFEDSFHLLYLHTVMTEQDVEIPSFFNDVVLAQISKQSRSTDFVVDFEYIYNVLKQAGRIYKTQQEGKYAWLDAELAGVVNEYMVGFDAFHEDGFNWNFNTSGNIRDRNTLYNKYFGLPDPAVAKDAFKVNIKYVIDVVMAGDNSAKLLDKGLGFEAEVTPLEKDPSAEGSETAKAIVAKIKALGSLSNYNYVGWKAPEGTEDKTGYLSDAIDAWVAIAAEIKSANAMDSAYISAMTSREDREAWDALAAGVAALAEKTEKFNTFAIGDVFTEKKDYSATEAFAEIVRISSLIKAGKKDPTIATGYERNVTDAGANVKPEDPKAYVVGCIDRAITSARLCSFVQFFRDNKIDLPAYAGTLLKGIEFDTFYNDFYLPLYKVVQIAQAIGSKADFKMEDLTDAQTAILNQIYVSSYVPKGELKAQLENTNGRFAFWGVGGPLRGQCIIEIAGGTLKGAEDNALNIVQYIDTLNKALTDNGYTINTNQWGVTGGSIVNSTLTKAQLAVITEFGALTAMPGYVDYKGWVVPSGAGIKGYMYSELQAFRAIKAKYEALTAEEKEVVSSVVDVASWDGWEAFEELNVQESYAAFADARLTLNATPMGTDDPKVYEGTELMAELYRWAIRISNGTQFSKVENDDANNASESGGGQPSTICRVGNTLYPAMRMVNIYNYCLANEIEIPAFVNEELTKCGFADFLESYEAIAGTAKLAARIEAGDVETMADTTKAEFDMLNKFWTNGYEINYLIRWNWNDNKFVTYYNARTLAIIKNAGVEVSKKNTHEYYKVVSDWLAGLGFTVKANGWGVTADAFTGGGTAEEPGVPSEPTYTQPEGSLLPDKASGFTPAAGVTVTAASDKFTLVNSANDAPMNKAAVNKTFTIAGNSVYFDAEAAAEGKYDLVIYAAGTYTSIAKILANSKDAPYDLTVKQGSVTLADVVKMLNVKAPGAVAEGATELAITEIAVCTGNNATVTVRDFRIAKSPVSVMPTTAESVTTREGTPASTITIEDGALKVACNHTDWTFNDYSVDQTVSVADDLLYFDLSVLGEKCDIILYDANDKYVTIGTHFNTKYGITGEKSGSLTGADLLTLFKARDAANYTDATTEITIKKISIYVYTGTTVTVNQLYVAPTLA